MPLLTIRWNGTLLNAYERVITDSDADFIRDVLDYPPEQTDPVTAAKAQEDRADWTEAEQRFADGDR